MTHESLDSTRVFVPYVLLLDEVASLILVRDYLNSYITVSWHGVQLYYFLVTNLTFVFTDIKILNGYIGISSIYLTIHYICLQRVFFHPTWTTTSYTSGVFFLTSTCKYALLFQYGFIDWYYIPPDSDYLYLLLFTRTFFQLLMLPSNMRCWISLVFLQRYSSSSDITYDKC